MLRDMCMDQNKVIVIADRDGAIPYEHTNMKALALSRFLFKEKALVHVLTKPGRKQQKGINFIFTDDPSFHSLIMKFKALIPARIVFEDNMEKLSRTVSSLVRDKKNEGKSHL
jgi:hypothetical protein